MLEPVQGQQTDLAEDGAAKEHSYHGAANVGTRCHGARTRCNTCTIRWNYRNHRTGINQNPPREADMHFATILAL